MSAPENGDRSTPGQTIVIERRERSGRRRLLLLLLMFSVFLNLVLFAGRSGVGLGHLEEKYVAGSMLPTSPKIAIIEVKGTILEANVESILKQVRQARDDPRVKGVVLRVESPGGSLSGSDQIWREVATLRAKEIPLVASFGGMAASGGYYVSASADLIFAEPTCLSGSIGVKLQTYELSGLMQKVGVADETITTGAWKDMGSMFHRMSPEERSRWQQLLDDGHARFVRVVAQGRKLSLEATRALADGRVYTTQEALDAKLVDRVGYLDDAIAYVQGRAGLESARVVRYAKPYSLVDALVPLGSAGPTPSFAAEALDQLRTPRIMAILR